MNEYQSIRAQKHNSIAAQVTCALMTCALVLLSCNVFCAAKTDELPISQSEKTNAEDLKRQLSKDNLSPPETGRIAEYVSDRPIDEELQKVIAQIRSAKIGQEQPVSSVVEGPVRQTVITPEPTQTASSNVADEAIKQKTEDKGHRTVDKIDAANSSSAISDLTQQTIDDLLNDPNISQNLTKLEPKQAGFKYKELAEVLFKCGSFHQAGQCYKRAYELLPADDANLVSDKNWLLFQIGNCFEYDDPNTARENFALLLRTNPASPWTDVAKFRYDLADWLQREQPKKLIDELNGKSESNQ